MIVGGFSDIGWEKAEIIGGSGSSSESPQKTDQRSTERVGTELFWWCGPTDAESNRALCDAQRQQC